MIKEHVVCPFCFWNRPLRSRKAEERGTIFGEYEGRPSDVPVIQLREFGPGPGRGRKEKGAGGWPVAGELTLEEALADPGYSETASWIRDRLVALVNDYLEAGVIDPSELRV